MLSSSTRSVFSSQLKRIARNAVAATGTTTASITTSSSASTTTVGNPSALSSSLSLSSLPLTRRFQKALFSDSLSATSSAAEEEQQPAFSSYEYPTRTEAPEITTSKASDASTSRNATTANTSTTKLYKASANGPDDPFDDSGSLSAEEREDLKAKQAETIGAIKLSSFPISPTVPSFVPSNVSSEELKAPETTITTLENGIRVVSQETYSQMCTIGVLTNVGSRHESVTGTVSIICNMQ